MTYALFLYIAGWYNLEYIFNNILYQEKKLVTTILLINFCYSINFALVFDLSATNFAKHQ